MPEPNVLLAEIQGEAIIATTGLPHQSEYVICSETTDSIVDSQERCMNTAKLTSSNVITPTKLSSREHEVLKLIVAGHSNPEIATKLYLSQSTVKTHVRGILNKLGVNHRVQAAVVALQIGLV